MCKHTFTHAQPYLYKYNLFNTLKFEICIVVLKLCYFFIDHVYSIPLII